MRESKIGEYKFVIDSAEEDIIRFDISMHHMQRMQYFQVVSQIVLKLIQEFIAIISILRTKLHQKLNAIIIANYIVVTSEDNLRTDPKQRAYFVYPILLQCFF